MILRWAKSYESTARAYSMALAEAGGGVILRDAGATLTIFPHPHTINSVISPRFLPENAAKRVERILAAAREFRRDVRFKLGPSTTPADLGDLLLKRGLRRSGSLCYMACPLAAFPGGRRLPPGLAIRAVDDFAVFRECSHPRLGRATTSKARHLLATYQELAQRRPRRHWMFVVDASRGAACIATCTLLVHRHTAGLFDFLVEAPYRRQGIGSALLQHVCAFAQAQGASLVALVSSTQGTRFYPRFGFVPTGRYPTYVYSREMQIADAARASAGSSAGRRHAPCPDS